MNISELCLRRPVLAAVMSILIVILGIAGLTRAPIRELPDIDTAEVTVSVQYVGAGPAVVDSEIITVIEGAVASVPGIDSIESEAELGSSRSVITFDPGRDIDQAAADVRAAVQSVAPDLPELAEEPEVEKNDSEGDPIVRLTMTSTTLSPPALTDYADRYVTDRIETVDGVASVDIYGERAYAMRVWLDTDAMAARGITTDEIAAALENNNIELPAGEIETDTRTFLLRTQTRLSTPEEFAELVVTQQGDTPIRLGDVAEVQLGVEDDDSSFRIDGETAIGLGVLRQSRANTLQISMEVAALVEEIGDDLPAGTSIRVTSDDAIFIRNSIAEVLKTLGIAVAIVVAVIYVFLASLRATIIPAVTIPIALLGACAGIAFVGFSINILTLFALILAIGLVVDDAIVVLENIERRIEDGEPPQEAAREGAKQVFFAVIATSATLIAVFVPLSFLQGEIGRLFTEFGITLALAVIVSTFVALSLCPVLASRLLKHADQGPSRFRRIVFGATDKLSKGYRRLLVRALGAPAFVLGVAALLSGASYSLWTNLPSELTPEEDRGVFFVSVDAPAGSNLGFTDRAVSEVEEILAPYVEDGEIENVVALVGRYGEVGSAFVVASLAPWGERDLRPDEIISEIRPALSAITLADIRPFAPSGLGAGGGSTPLEVIVNAPSFEQAAEWSEDLEEMLRDDPSVTDVRRDYEVNTPGYDIRVNRDRARELGIDARTISATVQTIFASAEVTEFIDRDRQYPVLLQARERARATPDDLRGVNIRTEGGTLVPLDGLIEVERRASVRAFNRYDRQPSVEVSGGLAEGVDLATAIQAVENAADQLPPGLSIAYSGQAESFQETSGGLIFTFGIALLVVFLVLAAQFESFIQPIAILLSVPLALTGALLTIFFTGQAINVYSQVGMVMLIGLMAKNGILIVEFANQLRAEGKTVRDAAIEASTVRLRPILMTVLSTVLGAVPLVLSSGAGAESRISIGLVIIGGFLAASILNLFLTPVLYTLLQRDATEPAPDASGTEAAPAE
ncbi:efflux RND transporter permease subunit [uncultured Jannaschia sp.]|uniref:efflux RND transporter permease subunit n=1 Tax=uncultured Jannaschia sp. TaxID=293347 RepID=UPI00261DBE73|nr:efflux RND transporter permease subunit [uncultured Jannaschia sp.]